jgi:hypothetical protein
MAPALASGNNLEDGYQSRLSPHPQMIRVSMSMDPLWGFLVKSSEFEFVRVPWHSSPAPVLPAPRNCEELEKIYQYLQILYNLLIHVCVPNALPLYLNLRF